MGEGECFLCHQRWGRRGPFVVIVFGEDGVEGKKKVCLICHGLLRQRGQIEVEIDGGMVYVRDLPIPEPQP